MVMGKAAVVIDLDATERRELQSLARAQKTGQAMARRARIMLAAAAGMENKAICFEVGADANTVGKWRRRFAADRLDGLLDEPRPGTPRKIGDDEIADTIRRTLETTPDGATHWSLRSMSKAVGYAPSTIHRIWRAFGLQPHRTETFKLSPTHCLSKRCAPSSASIYRRPSERWCFASTRSRRSRLWTARNPCCRCGQAKWSGGPTITLAMARRPSLLHSILPPGQSSAAAIQSTGQASSESSLTR